MYPRVRGNEEIRICFEPLNIEQGIMNVEVRYSIILYRQRPLIAFLNLVTSLDHRLKEQNQSKFKPYAV